MNKSHLLIKSWDLVFIKNNKLFSLMTTCTDEYAMLPRCCSFDPRMHNLLSGNVAVSTFVFLLLHPNLVCKTKMVYFGKFACFLYIDVGKGATISTTCWTVLMTCGAVETVRSSGERVRIAILFMNYITEIELLGSNRLVSETETHNHCFGPSPKESETGGKRSFFLYLQLYCCLC